MVDIATNFGCCIFFLHLGIFDYNMVISKDEPIAESAATLLLLNLNFSAFFIRNANSKQNIRVENNLYFPP